MIPVGPENYRECARAVIKKYADEGRLIDAIVWRTIVAEYERALGIGDEPSITVDAPERGERFG